MESRTQLDAALAQIVFARGYTKLFLADLEPDDWFWQPKPDSTHIAWQVGHLAVAQYSLCVRRTRGTLPEDETLISSDFRSRFGKGSIPATGAAANLPIAEIKKTFDRVQEFVMNLHANSNDEMLSEISLPEHPAFQTKLGALFWSGQHELIHAGQIGLLRRLRGKQPLR